MITTHILDTSKGKPAAGISIILYAIRNGDWQELSRGVTNADGRVTDLLEKGDLIQPGAYKLRFEIKDYFNKDKIKTFYPFIEIVFDIGSDEHYHVPLLLNPFGYSTYRGS